MNTFDYPILSEGSVADYIAEQPHLRALVDVESLTVTEVGDGNLNLVFICRDGSGRGVVLKQSLPYVRAAGEGWPLTPERATAEARGLRAGAEVSEATSPAFIGYDESRYILAMEDLSALTVWRTELNDGRAFEDSADHCGRHVAKLLAHTGLMTLTPEEFRHQRSLLPNTAMCDITEQLVFTEPYIDHEHNEYRKQTESVLAEIRGDDAFLGRVQRLKKSFITTSDCLIHGDLHTGSVMVGQTDGGDTRTVAMDPEFCFYGPVAYDIGVLLGNYLAAMVRAQVLGREELAAQIRTLPGSSWQAFEEELRGLWATRASQQLGDQLLEPWLIEIKQESIGFGACEAVRRMVGFAKLSDIETLPDEDVGNAAARVLRAAQTWMLNAEDLQPQDLLGEALK